MTRALDANGFRSMFRSVVAVGIASGTGLLWATAISDSVKSLAPAGGSWLYELVTALVVTGLAVVAFHFLDAHPASCTCEQCANKH